VIFQIFSPNFSAKKLPFLARIKANLCKMLIITLVFEKNANFFAEICQKLQKIVIIASTPDELEKKITQNVAQPNFLSKCMHNLFRRQKWPNIKQMFDTF
jgi:hypothetical protein